MNKDSRRTFPENTDRWIDDGLFPSAVYAGLKQSTKRNGGCTVLFNGEPANEGFIVGNNFQGFTLTRREFYSSIALETDFDPRLKLWRDLGYDGFGSWLDDNLGLICIDPITICCGIWTATELAKQGNEKAIYDVENKTCIKVQ